MSKQIFAPLKRFANFSGNICIHIFNHDKRTKVKHVAIKYEGIEYKIIPTIPSSVEQKEAHGTYDKECAISLRKMPTMKQILVIMVIFDKVLNS